MDALNGKTQNTASQIQSEGKLKLFTSTGQKNGSTFRAADRFTDIEKKFKAVDKELKELHSQIHVLQSGRKR